MAGIGMAQYRTTVAFGLSDNEGNRPVIQEYVVRNAILTGKLPRPVVNESGRFEFFDADIQAGIEFFARKLGINLEVPATCE